MGLVMANILPQENRLRFFVYIIESPSPVDLYHRRGEGDLLVQAIRLNRIPCIARLAVNLEAFIAALRVGLHEAMEATPDAIPILHISAHGFDAGIQLCSGEIITWAQLREVLVPINKALSGSLMVCMSTCEGYAGSRMAMVQDEVEHPYFAIIGNSKQPTWPETAVAFTTLYHLIANGRYLTDAVGAMRNASGNDAFFITTAEESKQGYLEYIKNIDAIRVMQQLKEDRDHSQTGGELAKMLLSNKTHCNSDN